ncbi:MAG: gamma-glutamylcyclotransferase family protein [Geobacter sp.]
MFYFAYGSNLWREQMRLRCPDARCLGTGRLDGFRWLITSRGYASMVRSAGDSVFGTVYLLSEADERSLDRYEGVADGCYRKELVTVWLPEQLLSCLTYLDPVQTPGQPKAEYIQRINSGLADAQLPEDYLARSIRPFVPDRSERPGE